MRQLSDFKALGGRYSVRKISGVVLGETTRPGTGQTIRLRDDQGAERAVQLDGSAVPCRAGHRMTLLATGNGDWFRIINHSTDQAYEDLALLRTYTYSGRLHFWITVALLLVGGAFSWLDESKGRLAGLLAAAGFAALWSLILYLPLQRLAIMRSRRILDAVEQQE